MNAALSFPETRRASDHSTQQHSTQQHSTQQHSTRQHPTQEFPALTFAPPQAAQTPPSSRLGALVNHLVTAILVGAVAAMLLVNVGPLFLPYRVYTVLSGSMQPTIPIGSEVVLRQADASQVRVGDIITFARPGHAGQMVTHRVVSIAQDPQTGRREFITRGDANAVSDDWRIPAEGPGLVQLFHVPFLGYAFAMLQSPLGRICFILAPAMLLAAVVLNDLWKAPRQADDRDRTA